VIKRVSLLNGIFGVALLSCVGAWPVTLADDTRRSGDSPANLATEAVRRGDELRRKWNLDAAEAAFREATALEPANLDAALGLTQIARARLDYPLAISLLDKVAGQHPNSADVFTAYGTVYLAAEEPDRARRYLEEALHINASDVSAMIALAGVDLLAGDCDAATRRLRECLTREPENSAAHAMLARVLLQNTRYSEATAAAEHALGLDAFNTEALYTLALVKSAERKADDARSLTRRAVSLDSFNFCARRVLSQYLDGQIGYEQKVSERARLPYAHGRMLKQDGELTKAAAEFEAALRVEPRYYRALIGLGDIRLRQQDYDRAVAVAKLATEVDPEGALAHLELSCAYRGINERARIEIGAVDFSSMFNSRSLSVYGLTQEVFPNYGALTRPQQTVIDLAVAPLAGFLPKLARNKSRHYLLAFDQRPSDQHGFADVAGEKTFDGRYYASLRGVGGRVTVSGIEYLDQAAAGGFNTIAHEFAHQVHMAAMDKREVKEIRRLYERARRGGRTLDYYAAANEHEYFAQGYEAFVSVRKRPSASITARHTNHELMTRDPELYEFILKLTGRHQVPPEPLH